MLCYVSVNLTLPATATTSKTQTLRPPTLHCLPAPTTGQAPAPAASGNTGNAGGGGGKSGTFVSTGNRLLDKLQRDKVRVRQGDQATVPKHASKQGLPSAPGWGVGFDDIGRPRCAGAQPCTAPQLLWLMWPVMAVHVLLDPPTLSAPNPVYFSRPQRGRCHHKLAKLSVCLVSQSNPNPIPIPNKGVTFTRLTSALPCPPTHGYVSDVQMAAGGQQPPAPKPEEKKASEEGDSRPKFTAFGGKGYSLKG